AEVPLALRVVGPVEERVVRRVGLGEGLDDRDELGAEVAEGGVHLGPRRLRLVLVEERVVAAALVAEGLCLLDAEVHDLPEVRRFEASRARACARGSRATSSAESFVARSKSRRVTRTSARSNSSSTSPSSPSRRAPTASSVKRRWASVLSVASWWARASAAP